LEVHEEQAPSFGWDCIKGGQASQAVISWQKFTTYGPLFVILRMIQLLYNGNMGFINKSWGWKTWKRWKSKTSRTRMR
jgi:hypothetical protein